MGLFISMSGVVTGEKKSVVDALSAYAQERQGALDKENLTFQDEGCLTVASNIGGVTVLYPEDFADWDNAAGYLSKRVGRPVFSFHVHDGDLWMYILFENGKIVDQFNPLPDYWEELDAAERKSWEGNAAAVARRVPGLAPDEISNYLIPWDDDLLGSARKAYPTDQSCYGIDWQLLDFMGKLGLAYPEDGQGNPQSDTYRFRVGPRRRTNRR